jgi:nicotinamidase-related amidase
MDRLDPKTTVLLVVDVQEKLAAAMDADALERVVKHTGILVDAAKILGVPVITSEQYPKGLGPTVAALKEKLPNAPHPKLTFDAASDLGIARNIADLAPRSIVVAGMESHVCVFQTARELVRRGFDTHVVSDAVCSRKDRNRKLGLSLCERAGAIITGTETVLFDLLGVAGTEQFKAVSKLIR